MVITPIDVFATGIASSIVVIFYARHAVNKIRQQSRKLEIAQ